MAPWAGYRVVDLSGLAGAYGSRLLAALGAEVIRVEPPEGDALRRMAPQAPGVAEPEAGLWWAFLAAGTRSVVINRSSPDGERQLAALLATADVVLDDAPAALQDRPISGHSAVRAANPGAVWVAITPFGLTGPRRDWKTSDLVAWASCGLASTIGFPDAPPLAPAAPVQLALHFTAINATIGAMLALRARRRTGRGQLVEVSIQEAMLSMAPETGVPLFLDDQVPRPRAGNRRPVTSPFGLFPCQDGHVVILALQPNHWQSMARWVHEVTGNDGVLDEVFNDISVRHEAAEAIDAWTEELTATGTKLELFVEGQRRGIPITPVNTVADLRADPHLAQAGWWRNEAHPCLGQVQVPGAPFLVSHNWWAWSVAPTLGQHTADVLGADVLGADVLGADVLGADVLGA
jgi:crotonobetainyl-CoA:carnitine CoA-transferase CaiB-like acyl-CoA transferase